MSGIMPRNYVERLLMSAARSRLPLAAAEIARNEWGKLYVRWPSGCAEIESLWVSVAPNEIVLSNRITHNHYYKSNYRLMHVTNRHLKQRIVRDGVTDIAKFLRGEIAAIKSYQPDGLIHSLGWCDMAQLDEHIAYSRKVFGEQVTHRAWNWFGEVAL